MSIDGYALQVSKFIFVKFHGGKWQSPQICKKPACIKCVSVGTISSTVNSDNAEDTRKYPLKLVAEVSYAIVITFSIPDNDIDVIQ